MPWVSRVCLRLCAPKAPKATARKQSAAAIRKSRIDIAVNMSFRVKSRNLEIQLANVLSASYTFTSWTSCASNLVLVYDFLVLVRSRRGYLLRRASHVTRLVVARIG